MAKPLIMDSDGRQTTMDDNFTINIDAEGNATVVLSDYAAWAVLRKLLGDEPSDKSEAKFVDAFAEQLSSELCAII